MWGKAYIFLLFILKYYISAQSRIHHKNENMLFLSSKISTRLIQDQRWWLQRAVQRVDQFELETNACETIQMKFLNFNFIAA